MNRSEDQLHDDLARGAEVFDARGGRERTIDEVLGTARTIRRRRRAGAGLVAAAVLAAVAVPVGLAMGGQQTTAPPPATTTTPTPRPVQRIGLGDLPVGRTPATGWVDAGTWHAPDGTVVKAPARIGEVRAAARTTGGVVVASNTEGHSEAWLLHDDGRVDDLGAMGSLSLARSPQGHVVAFAGPDGRPIVVQDGQAPTVLPAVGGLAQQAVAVSGEQCGPHGDCVVYLTALDAAGPGAQNPGQSTWASGWLTPTAPTAERLRTRIQTVADVDSDGRRAGIVSRFQSGTCSEVEDTTGRKLWDTCTARFDAFSPDDAHLLGMSPYGDGLGSTDLTVFEPSTGAVQLHLRTLAGVVITQLAWEDDSHVLAAVIEAGRAAVIRIGLDGRAEYAVPPVTQHDDVNPLLLPAS
ncbi:MAG: hypothetical protein ACTHNS_01925 [Marmoricola sp.]